MDDYDWQRFENTDLPNRFPTESWIVGLAAWKQGAAEFVRGNSEPIGGWVRAIEASGQRQLLRNCPRVFVSHRKTDVDPARRIAYEASLIGFDFWLDVIDLAAAKTAQVAAIEFSIGRLLRPFELSVLTAAIIEMALVNCTHVLAVMTSNTAGSLWVPYEYGRIVDRSTTSLTASSWCDTTTLNLTKMPEYMHLAPVHLNQTEIRKWLSNELLSFPGCVAMSRCAWSDPIPKTLPTG